MPTYAFNFSKVADAALVGVGLVRCHQRRGLLKEAEVRNGNFSEYSPADVQRLGFVKGAQDLGFTLDDIAELVSLSGEREKKRVREVTGPRPDEIKRRIVQLNAMADVLRGLVLTSKRTETTDARPIIGALVGVQPSAVRVEATAVSKQARGVKVRPGSQGLRTTA